MFTKSVYAFSIFPGSVFPPAGTNTPTNPIPPTATEEFTVGGSFVVYVFDNTSISKPWGIEQRTN